MLRFLTLALALLMTALPPAHATEAGWALLREGGQAVLLVNANAPGTGDPARFDIDNCRTQRNLSERGRQQARRIGALFAARAEPVETVYTSRYCRAAETARLAFGDRLVEPMAALDSIAGHEDAAEAANAEVIAAIRDYTGSGNLVLVTHPENVLALAGVRAREGEAVIVAPRDDGLAVIGRIVFN
ncbi:MAG TPA: histidine phosphatase family protein [Aquamicrobium sp.]|jgi:phosphohistidine phosphatase SixA|nr:histidine phosphatase family protein [Aquamicrobium sp.]